MKRESSVASGCVFVFMKEENCPFLPFVASLPQSSTGFELQRYENNEVKLSSYSGSDEDFLQSEQMPCD